MINKLKKRIIVLPLVCLLLVQNLLATEAVLADTVTEGKTGGPTASSESDSVGEALYAEEGELLILVEEGTTKREIREIAQDVDASVEQVTEMSDGTSLVKISMESDDVALEEAIEELDDQDSVIIAQPNYRYELPDNETVGQVVTTRNANNSSTLRARMTVGNGGRIKAVSINDSFKNALWHLDSIKAYDAWERLTGTGSNTIVAVIDSGCLRTHEDLKNVVLSDKCRSVTNGQLKTFTADGYEDSDGHGTHVSGIIAAETNNSKGVSGVINNRAKLLVVDAMNEDGFYTEDMIVAIDYCISQGAKVINMSLGGEHKDLLYDAEIKKCADQNIVCVIAAGNEYTDVWAMPSDTPYGISVINHTSANAKAPSSNYGYEKDIAAPGTDIASTYNASNSSYIYMTGTSMASPVVAGAATLLFAEDSSLTTRQVKNLLYATATGNANQSFSTTFGWGRLDLDAAIEAVHTRASSARTIRLNKNRIDTYVGNQAYLEWAVWPANNTEKSVATFTSSNTRVATVDKYGIVTGVSEGTATITATCGSARATCTVTVENPYEKLDMPYLATKTFDVDDALSTPANNSDSTNYMHGYEITLAAGETIKARSSAYYSDTDPYPVLPYLKLFRKTNTGKSSVATGGPYLAYATSGKKLAQANLEYTATVAGTYYLESTSSTTYKGDYELAVVSSNCSKNLRAETTCTGNKVSVSWDRAPYASGYQVTTYYGTSSYNSTVTANVYEDTINSGSRSYSVAPYVTTLSGDLKVVGSQRVTATAGGHNYDYDNIVWNWGANNTSATATFVCKTDRSHTTTVNATVTTEGSGANRVRVATVTGPDGNKYSTRKADPETVVSETWELYYWSWGSNNTIATATFLNRSTYRTQRVTATVTSAVTKAATCEEAGTRTYTASAKSPDGKEYTDTKTATIAALGHSWSLSGWNWSSNLTSATASFVCKNDASHTRSINATVTTEGSGTNRVSVATVTGPDGVKYTDRKSNPDNGGGNVTETWTVSRWRWGSDYKSATATFTSSSGKTSTVTGTVTLESSTATCGKAGYATYKAEVQGPDGKVYTDKKTVYVNALEHDWETENLQWKWYNQYSSYYRIAEAVQTCRTDSSHTRLIRVYYTRNSSGGWDTDIRYYNLT